MYVITLTVGVYRCVHSSVILECSRNIVVSRQSPCNEVKYCKKRFYTIFLQINVSCVLKAMLPYNR